MPNRKLIQQWVNALRSGYYHQAFYTLKEGPTWSPSYCAIGVLGQMTNQLHKESWGSTIRLKGSSSQVWSGVLADMTGLEEPTLWYNGERKHIAALNDSCGLSFDEIADLIEEQYLDSSSDSQTTPPTGSNGLHAPSPTATPALQEVGLSNCPAPTGSDSSSGEREAYEAEEEGVMA